MKKNKSLPAGRRGFTLIELLVVIAIIGILSTIVLVSLNSARQKARDTRRLGDLREVALALEMYYDDNSSYPTVTGCSTTNWATMAGDIETGEYMTKVPDDPLNSGSNVYMYGSSGTKYTLSAVLENASNAAFDTDLDTASDGCTCTDPTYCIQP